ncbi:MAG: haloalkane dehalogenase [Actinomycetota bacterium]|nr:haloalkane dehalogenase [Actinomycetota bacterium]
MNAYRTPDERFRNLPGYEFEPHYTEVDGLRMHFVDQGSGDETILLLHGEPTWSYLYRKMIPPLASRGRVVAPDLIGFGRSDKPTDRAFYTYESHVSAVGGFVRALDLSNITLVVHDWAGAIGLRVAVEDEKRFARLVVLNTGLFSGSERCPTPGFMEWRNFAERVGLDLPVGRIVQSATSTALAPDVLAAYEAPFPVPESKVGAAMFPLLVPLSKDDPGAAEMLRTREALSRWTKPALVYFSDSDPVFPPGVAKAMARVIPTAGEPEILPGASHFLQEDKGEEVAARILRFLAAQES